MVIYTIGDYPKMGNCNIHMERTCRKYPLNNKGNWDHILDDLRLM